MTIISKTLAKGTIATIAAGAMAMTAATPAMANDRDRGGISAGEVIAGALIIGGIAAVAGSVGNNRGYNGTYGDPYYGNSRYDDRNNGRYDNRYGYNRLGDSRQAVQQCVAAAERGASRNSYGRAQVTDIRNVQQTRDGYRIQGRIAVNQQSNNRYGSGWGNDYRNNDYRNNDYRNNDYRNNDYRNNDHHGQGYDTGNFRCDVSRGRIVDLHYSGIHGLR